MQEGTGLDVASRRSVHTHDDSRVDLDATLRADTSRTVSPWSVRGAPATVGSYRLPPESDQPPQSASTIGDHCAVRVISVLIKLSTCRRGGSRRPVVGTSGSTLTPTSAGG